MSILFTEKMREHLTPKQCEAYPHLKWLFGLGPRGSGRTMLVALIIIEQSIEQGTWVPLFNHDCIGYPPGSHYQRVNTQEVMMQIAKLMELTPDLEFNCRELGGGRGEVKVQYRMDKKEKLFLGKWTEEGSDEITND